MRMQDFENELVIRNEGELFDFIAIRYGEGVNEFWLTEEESKFPALAIMVKKDLACLHYFPYEGHAGFISSGTCGIDCDDVCVFVINRTEDQEILKDCVVFAADAVRAATEFFVCKKMPESIAWDEL